jgi:hypothetical protein
MNQRALHLVKEIHYLEVSENKTIRGAENSRARSGCPHPADFTGRAQPHFERIPHEQQDGVKQGCFSRICSCGRCEICSLSPSPANQVVQKVEEGCMTSKVSSTTRDAARTIGKHFPC